MSGYLHGQDELGQALGPNAGEEQLGLVLEMQPGGGGFRAHPAPVAPAAPPPPQAKVKSRRPPVTVAECEPGDLVLVELADGEDLQAVIYSHRQWGDAFARPADDAGRPTGEPRTLDSALRVIALRLAP